jgi:DHA2 family multidrug resistance protein
MLCGTSCSIQELIFWRIVQGSFGGGLIATAQAVLRDTFPKSKFGLSQGLFSIGAIVGPAVGPTLGGWLTDNFSWNWVFFINLVPGIFAGTVMLMRLKNPNDPRRVPLDIVGLALLIIGLGSLQYVLGEGQQNDWFSDQRILTVAIVSGIALLSFIGWELFGTQNPVVDLRVLRYKQVAAGSILAFAIGSTLYAGIVIFPQYTQGILGFTAMLSGELIFVRAAFIALFTPLAVRLAISGKVDTRILLLSRSRSRCSTASSRRSFPKPRRSRASRRNSAVRSRRRSWSRCSRSATRSTKRFWRSSYNPRMGRSHASSATTVRSGNSTARFCNRPA